MTWQNMRKKDFKRWILRPRRPSNRAMFRTIKQSLEKLSNIPNVHHVGIARGETGKKLKDACVTIFVTKKVRLKDLSARHRIPRFLLSSQPGRKIYVRTDVQEMPGLPQLLLRGGAIVKSADGERGTVGLVFQFQNNNYCITNAHVVSDPGGPAYNVAVGPTERGGFGTVVQMNPLNPNTYITSDAALVRISGTPVEPWASYTDANIMRDFFRDLNAQDVQAQMKCRYVAFDSEYGSPREYPCSLFAIVPGAAPIAVDGVELNYASFYKFRPTGNLPAPVEGHSGSLILYDHPSGTYGVALLFGGCVGSEIWAFPAKRCYDSMMYYFRNKFE